jgi:hypothetical protein
MDTVGIAASVCVRLNQLVYKAIVSCSTLLISVLVSLPSRWLYERGTLQRHEADLWLFLISNFV